ncbi:MAG: hypothetical protein VX730_09175 [Pseudomonadota bacterium]|nr:hypothetical protein [Pseudomonadota bacterium]
MKRILFSILAVNLVWNFSAAAQISLDEELVDKTAQETSKITIRVLFEGENFPSYTWDVPQPQKPILFTWLKDMARGDIDRDPVLAVHGKVKEYRGLEIEFFDYDGGKLETITLYNELVKNDFGDILFRDLGRYFEYWVWSTTDVFELQDVAAKVLPIYAFEQCLRLGNPIIETYPRQCLLADGDIFLEVNEKPTLEALLINNFDDCLEKGQALINTFPRRCVAAGGHVYTEPPRLFTTTKRRENTDKKKPEGRDIYKLN